MNDKTCIWTYDRYTGYDTTNCGNKFYLVHELAEKFKFCPYCGGRISLASEKVVAE
jgi:rRNA maturation endonuclease Nob1